MTNDWPTLVREEWEPTRATLHLCSQMVGKTRLALAPMQNHWWHTTLYVTSRGLGTSPIPYDDRTFEVDFDFFDHRLTVRTSDGETQSLSLVAQPVAEFYRNYLELLDSLGLDVRINPVPSEIANPIPFLQDNTHGSYDGGAAERCWRTLVSVDRVLKEFRGGFIGKCSPVHFWWGGFDLACTRFSGRRAPTHPSVPNIPDYVTREAYSHECISAGWWPGDADGPVNEAVFYAYAYPEPSGCPEATIKPAEAYYHPVMREWILPYDAVSRSPVPEKLLGEFLQSTYETAADLGEWDRAALERERVSTGT